MTTTTTQTQAETEVRQLITHQANAICAKAVPQLMSCYAPNIVLFDVKPPFQIQGVEAVRQMWETCLPYFPDNLQMEQRDLQVMATDAIAIAHWLFRFTGMEAPHPAMATWMRCTASYQRLQGQWRVVHEHVSVPFNPETVQAVFSLEP